MDWKSLFFSAEGRIGRQAFWIGWLMLLGAHVVAGWIPVIGHVIGLIGDLRLGLPVHQAPARHGPQRLVAVLPIVLGPVLIIGSAMWIGFGRDPGRGHQRRRRTLAALAGVGGLLVSLAIACVSVDRLHPVGRDLRGPAGENRYGETPLTPWWCRG
jgi:uncharacterized membrane protein YhaH (DUF805 family)